MSLPEADKIIIDEIVEKILKWRRNTGLQGPSILYEFVDAENKDVYVNNEETGWKFNPLESLSDVWIVWEALRESGKWCCLEINSDYDYMYDIRLTPENLTENDEHKAAITVSDENICRAICRAALMTLEKQ